MQWRHSLFYHTPRSGELLGMSILAPFAENTEGIFFGVPHAAYIDAPGVSQSTLKEFGDAGSPLHFKTLPKREPSEDMIFGTLVHAVVLTPSEAGSLFYVRPDTY